MQIPRWDQLLVAFKRWIIPFTVMVGIILISLGLFVLLFGWERFLADFWPLDNSRVGPNLCASIAVVILITAHNRALPLIDILNAASEDDVPVTWE